MLDAINAGLQLVGAGFAWANFLQLRRDGQVSGIYWPSVAFFTAWGAWNLVYFPALNQWASFWAALLLVAGNAAWVAQVMIFKFKKRSV